ncbi:MAG: hypothetical protein JXA03_12550 [Bacteroidales bacterium]|nr:hypothetical protein [Bacteroidales bacterium]
MKQGTLQLVIAFLLTILQSASFAQTAVQPAGSGTTEDPYLVATLDNLYWITQNSSSWDKHFKQTAEIDASATIGWDGGAGFLPIGDIDNPFTGTYNGQGGTIGMLSVNRPGSSYVGMFGVLAGGSVENVVVITNVFNGNRYIGAIAGLAIDSALIRRCFVASQTGLPVGGNKFVGGIAGSLDEGTLLDESCSTVGVTGNICVGGLTGRNLADIRNCYAAGPVNGLEMEGGISGALVAPTVTNSFYDTDATGLSVSSGGTGKTTAEMLNLATYTDVATTGLDTPWDFVGVPYSDSGIADLWNMDTTGTFSFTYPFPSYIVLPMQPAGYGTQTEPYLIETLFNLYWLSATPAAWAPGVYIEQTADIAAYSSTYINFGTGWNEIGSYSNPFYGHYNGNGHEINGLTIKYSGNDYKGFFGNIEDMASITDVHLKDLNYTITDGISVIGGLVGVITSVVTHICTISKCSVSGTISSTAGNVGLLIGRTSSGTIDQCFTSGSVSGNGRVGGLLGQKGNISVENFLMSDCYSAADVTCNTSSGGGLIGSLSGSTSYSTTINNCYSTGQVSGPGNIGGFIGNIDSWVTNYTISASFWDTESSGTTNGVGNLDPDPAGIEGKTTAEMKTESTFTNAGWDFTNIWDIDGTQNVNEGYPYFQWMNTAKQLDIKVFLEGPFNGTEMNTDIYGALPLSQPYNTAPWNYTGTESVTAIPNTDVVDWILVELRDAPDAASAGSAAIVARQAAFLLKDGSIVSADGQSMLQFAGLSVQHSIFAVIRHRNHIAVMSAIPLTETGGVYAYDFTSGVSQAYGASQGHKELAPGIWGMTGADGNADSQVNNGDKNDVWAPQAGLSGYGSGDFNLDAQVNNSDKNDVWVPNTGLGGQVPQ